MLDELSCI